MGIRSPRRRSDSIRRPLELMSDGELWHVHMLYCHPDDPSDYRRSLRDMLRAGKILRRRGLLVYPDDEPPRNVDVSGISPEKPLEYERRGSWPSWNARRCWWSRPEVPPYLRPSSEPDGRRVLDGEAECREYMDEMAELEAARLEWLEGQVDDA